MQRAMMMLDIFHYRYAMRAEGYVAVVPCTHYMPYPMMLDIFHNRHAMHADGYDDARYLSR